MAAPADALSVEHLHDGVQLTTRPALLRPTDLLFLAGPALVAAVYWMSLFDPLYVAGAGAVTVFVMGAAFLQRIARWRLRITERWIDVERRVLGRSTRWRIRIEKLRSCKVVEPTEDYGDPALVLVGDGHTIRLGEGRPIGELNHIAGFVGEAMATAGRRAGVEGRTYEFQKRAPEDVARLLDR